MPKVSIVMTLYNTPFEYLDKTIKSLLNQTFKDFEFIIIDDASSIPYQDYFKNLNDDRIKYYKLENNKGSANARNIGIQKAVGEYIASADSDDVYMLDRLTKQVEFLDKNPDIGLISSSYVQSNNGKVPKMLLEDEDIKVFMLFNSPFANPSATYRKKIMEEHGIKLDPSLRFGEDYALWMDFMFAGIKMANLADVLFEYTRRKGQLSQAIFDKQYQVLSYLYKKMLAKIGIEATDDEINLHYKIYRKNLLEFDKDEIETWLNKIINANKTAKLFDEQRLIAKKDSILEEYDKLKNRLFKIKIGKMNFCLSKQFKIYIERRY